MIGHRSSMAVPRSSRAGEQKPHEWRPENLARARGYGPAEGERESVSLEMSSDLDLLTLNKARQTPCTEWPELPHHCLKTLNERLRLWYNTCA